MSVWLVSAYAALALGLAWLVAGGSRWRWRAPYIVVAPVLAVGLWLGRPNPAGWPTSIHTPAHATLDWALVDEPDPAASDPGRIYLWLDVGRSAPRAFSVPYSRPLHERVQRALAEVKRVQSIGVALGAKRARGGPHAPSGSRSVLRFYPDPPVELPPKTRP